jgi:hypothetical protein
MRAWRERHPIRAVFQAHKQHAKERGICICWDYEGFKWWCEANHYPMEGFCIHRIDHTQGYFPENCACVPKAINDRLSLLEKKLKPKYIET